MFTMYRYLREIVLFAVCILDFALCTGDSDQVRTTFFIENKFNKDKPQLNIVGFFKIHKMDPKDSFKCGTLDIEYGFQTFLAFLFTIERLVMLPEFNDINLGGLVIETCDNNKRVEYDLFSLFHDNKISYGDAAECPRRSVSEQSIAAVLAFSSHNALSAVDMLGPRHITTISPSATSTTLNNKPYFLRTVLPSEAQGEVIAHIIHQLHWNCVTVIRSNLDFGKTSTEALRAATIDKTGFSTICDELVFTLNMDASLDDARAIIEQIDAIIKGQTAVTVLFTADSHTRLILQATKDLGLEGRFIWIGSTWWSNERPIIQGLEEVTRGAITLQPWASESKDFMDYMHSLTLQDHGRIPDEWFEEFWQEQFKCHLSNSTVTLNKYDQACADNLRLSPENTNQSPYVIHTILATEMIAETLTKMTNCDNSTDNISGCLEDFDNQREHFYHTIQMAEWQSQKKGDFNDTFQFNSKGYGNKGYTILHLQMTSQGKYEYVQLGSGHPMEGVHIDVTKYTTYNRDGQAITRVSTTECACASHTTGQGHPKGQPKETVYHKNSLATSPGQTPELMLIMAAIFCLMVIFPVKF